jgi:hypothetical protein
MSNTSTIIFGVASVFYILAWKYIRQLVRDVNSKVTGNRISIWRWQKGWRMHRQFFPMSAVRRRIVTFIALTVGLGLVAFCINTRNMLIHR